jgi:wyosine [tRNA(Phe)-imidazoG37] synthetase (radical SAM superfamily)
MLMRMPTDAEMETLAEILCSINPDEVQLNLPTRPIPRDYFLETRGNAVEFEKDFTRLKTISKDGLEKARGRLAELTNLLIIAR